MLCFWCQSGSRVALTLGGPIKLTIGSEVFGVMGLVFRVLALCADRKSVVAATSRNGDLVLRSSSLALMKYP
jgi:hypothetical protein